MGESFPSRPAMISLLVLVATASCAPQYENCKDGEVEEGEECDEKEVEECEIVPHEECHQVTVELPKLQDKQVQQIVCDQENEIEDATTTEKVAEQETNNNDVLENNYDEILDAVNTIFGSGITEDVKEIVTSTEAELLTTEEPAPTTTVLPSVPTTTTATTTQQPLLQQQQQRLRPQHQRQSPLNQ